jgi:pyruvate formate-lyase activating enzyme-like uncharacterized protein
VIVEITKDTLDLIKNPALRSYAEIYTRISKQFMERIHQTGIEIDPLDYSEQVISKINMLRKKGATIRNDGKSVFINQISPACVACQTGVGSATFFTSLKCNRDCFYCFNPNQENYDYYRENICDTVSELEAARKRKQRAKHLALTGGEPLLHKPEALSFFASAKKNFSGVHTRLYTSGDYVDQEVLESLKETHLDEIRFSIRMQDLERGNNYIFDRIALAKAYIPQVMVEMPILPDSLDVMKDILVRLDHLGLFSINLLELCFPLNNADEFKRRGYSVKSTPFRVLYDYWYAGGLPIARSELVCLDLLVFALDNNLKLGIHYCSLENKQTGQIYQQNIAHPTSKIKYFSRRDYFLKSAKVFGDDTIAVKRFFDRKGVNDYEVNEEYNYLEFHVSKIRSLKMLDVQIGLCTSVLENRNGEDYVRELKVELTTPNTFQLSKDV